MIGREGVCFLCGRYGRLDTHHIFGGPNRGLSDEDGLTVKLCRTCHEAAHKYKYVHDLLHQKGQEEYEKTHTREEFMRRYGRSWL